MVPSLLYCCVQDWDDFVEEQTVRVQGRECSGFVLNGHQQYN